jgi:hypothetical protein
MKLFVSLMILAAFSAAHAQDDATTTAADGSQQQAPAKAKKKKKKKAKKAQASAAAAATPTPAPAPSVKEDLAPPPTHSNDVGATAPQTETANTGKKDIDDEITNARLRATTGKKRRWSFWSQTIYNGAAITSPFSSSRPQLNSQNNADPTNVSSQVSAKYRLTEHDSLLAGIGLQYTPAHTDLQGDHGAQLTASTPYIDYNRAFAFAGIQNVIDASLSFYTLSQDLDQNLFLSWAVQDQSMYEFGGFAKHASLGFAASLGKDVYKGDGPQGGYINLQAAFEPIFEYAITDAVSFRTVYRWWIMNNIGNSNNVWQRALQSESIGIGWAITRDIYIYPNLQWAWGHMTWDTTTTGLQLNINL